MPLKKLRHVFEKPKINVYETIIVLPIVYDAKRL